jgi:chemotaxis protein methyltransferase CheR
MLIEDNTLSNKDYEKISKFIHTECGIKMPPAKKTMLEARLRKRMRDLNINSYSEYCDFVFNSKGAGNEIINMIDVITTNKTDFFREPKQFEFLYENALPELIDIYGAGTKRKLKIWSAGCSTGEEPYTIGMVTKEFARNVTYPVFTISITASDISTQVLEKAALAVYQLQDIEPVPIDLKKKYLLKSKDKDKSLVRIIPEIRNLVMFKRINFMEEEYDIKDQQDIIFCRNVLIYFDKTIQEKIISKLCNLLIPDGYLFIGHSESLFAMNLPLVQVASSIYRKIK